MRRLVDFMGVRRQETRKPSVPDGTAVFAIADIHGRVDLMVQMHQQLLQQAKILPESLRKTVIYLGDYINHGTDSAAVIDALVCAQLPGFQSIYLMGGHEACLLGYLQGVKGHHQHAHWLYQEGGLETLRSYSVDILSKPTPENLSAMRVQLLRKLPTDHIEFLQNLKLQHTLGDFHFVHAGVNPHRPLAAQNPSDLLNTHQNFLGSPVSYDKIIVHGESIQEVPEICANRIGINTYDSLGCFMAIGDKVSFLQAKSYA